MSAGTSAGPRFTKGQQVHFVGGTGAVKNYQFGPGYITYLVAKYRTKTVKSQETAPFSDPS
jgi:hypothetical protein